MEVTLWYKSSNKKEVLTDIIAVRLSHNIYVYDSKIVVVLTHLIDGDKYDEVIILEDIEKINYKMENNLNITFTISLETPEGV